MVYYGDTSNYSNYLANGSYLSQAQIDKRSQDDAIIAQMDASARNTGQSSGGSVRRNDSLSLAEVQE
jgi:hypothetical protein